MEALMDDLERSGWTRYDGLDHCFSCSHRLVGELDVERVAVGLGVHGNRLNVKFTACADDAESDLTTIGDEHAPKCRHCLRPGFDDDQGLAELHHGAVVHENRHDLARNTGLDVVHEFHDLDDADCVLGVHLLADLNE
jgi:hypothetical protein